WSKPTQHGDVDILLTNFTARIVADVVEDDGAELRRCYEIEAQLGGRTSTFTIPATQFAAMRWPTEHLGARAIVEPGFGAADHARTAIQRLSDTIDERVEFAHTG